MRTAVSCLSRSRQTSRRAHLFTWPTLTKRPRICWRRPSPIILSALKPAFAFSHRIHSMDAKFQWQEDVEDLEGYHRGGYHPVHVHDQYSDNRHQIIHKLGYGTCSTVWLARDLHQHRCVAIKILTADASEKSREAQILQRLNGGQGGGVHGGGKFVPTLLDQFEISGPNGRHLCLVTEPARCSIAASKEGRENWMFPLPIARALAAQAILALHKIHLHNVVHGGML